MLLASAAAGPAVLAGPDDCNVFVDHDTYMRENNPSDTFGNEEELRGRNVPGDEHRPLLHYDLSGLPPGSTIGSATAWFYVLDEDPAGPAQIRRATAAWVESTATWSSMNANFDPAIRGSFDATTTGWQSADLTSLVDDWHNGVVPNQGITLFLPGTDQSEFASSEYGTSSRRPCLEVGATPSGGSTLGGTVYEDPNADGSIADGVARSGVTVRFYRDDGDDVPDAGDTPAGSATTNIAGAYSISGLTAGTYWVAVDSKTISPVGLSGDVAKTWAEQTYGTKGALCATNGGSPSVAASASPCFAGRRHDVSDDASSLTTSEHVTRAVVGLSPVTGVNSGFGFTPVTTTRDGDDDPVSGRSVQGSLRQFIQNANEIAGGQRSIFRIPSSGSVSIAVVSGGLPIVLDSGTEIDATTQPGYDDAPLVALDGTGAGVNDGLKFNTSNGTVKGLAIHGFGRNGIEISGGGHVIQSNYIGLEADGVTASGNGFAGIRVTGGSNLMIGGPDDDEGNVISNSGRDGMLFTGSTSNNTIQANLIGTDASGVVPMGNGWNGIASTGTASVIGGSGDAGNVIAASGIAGIDLASGATGYQIQGNAIGTDRGGSLNLGNTSHGIYIEGGTNHQIGGAGGLANTIAHNGGAGVVVIDLSAAGHRITGNSIHDNTGLGIDLAADGVTPNDTSKDSDPGPNGLQNFPVITAAVLGTTTTAGSGTLDSEAATTYRIEYFASPAADPSGNGEGRIYIGGHDVTTAGSGVVNWTVKVPGAAPGALFLSGTATSPGGATSEFGPASAVTPGADLWLSKAIDDPTPSVGGTVVFTVTVTNDGPANATGVVVRDKLPTGYTYVSDDAGGNYNDNNGNWTVGAVNVGTPRTLNITATVDATGDYTNTAQVWLSDQDDPDSTPGNGVGQGEDDEASAFGPLSLSGIVAEDLTGDANFAAAVPRPGVTVRLYRDGGDGLANGVDDSFGGSTVTVGDGSFSFTALPGDYWVAVDSRSVTPSGGYSVGVAQQAQLWAEQTYGVAGARCDDGAGGVTTLGSAGACYAGRDRDLSDDSTGLGTSEHVTGVTITAGPVGGVNSAFTFFAVTHTADRDDDLSSARTAQGSLRQVVQNANVIPGLDSIALAEETYLLALPGPLEDTSVTGDLDVLDDLEITGAGTVTTVLDGGALDRVLDVHGVGLSVSDLTIRNGVTANNGGAVHNDGGAVALTRVAITGNTANTGGGVHNRSGSTMVLNDSVVNGNTSIGHGGGIDDHGAMLVSNVTVSGNNAGSEGGGIRLEDLTAIDSVTVTLNIAPTGAGIAKGGLAPATSTIRNSIVAGNVGGADCDDNLVSLGHNMDGDGSCPFGAPGDFTDPLPLLGPLSDNGGPTQTHALLTGSPAIDTGVTIACPATDQRGAARPIDGDGNGSARCDIGAYEAGAVAPGNADLGITKDDGATTYTPGGQVTYTIVASNAGPSAVVGATVSDNVTALPQVDAASWTCAAAGGASCTAGPVAGDINDSVDLPVGGTATYTLVVDLDSAATGDLTNTASVTAPGGITDPDASNDSATDVDTQGAPVADLGITKDDGVASYTPGGQVTYTLVASNAGPSAVTGATVTDNVTALPQVDSASWTCVAAGGASCTAGPVAGDINDTVNLPVGGTATYTLVVDLDPAATGNLSNTASVAPPGGTTDPDGTDDSATDVDTQGAGVTDLSITKDDGVGSYTAGTQTTYTIVATNAGPSAVTGATVTDAVTALPQVDAASWTCVAAGGASCTAGPVAGDINDTVNLPVGGTATYSLIVDFDAAATGNVVNTASIAPPGGTSDPNAPNDSATDTNTQGASVADLSITKDDGVASYTPGGQVTYTVVASNAGPSAVTGATVSDAVTALAQVDAASWTCVAAGGASCTAGPVAGDISDTVNLPVGGTATYTLVVDLDPAATGNLSNTASVAPPGGTTDPDGTNDSATDVDTQGAGIADLSITKDDGVSSYTAGGSVLYTIVVSNAGPSDVTGASVSDAVTGLPQVNGASWICISSGGASCTAGPVAGDINDTANIPAGDSVSYSLAASIDAAATGNLINTATVAVPGGMTDPDGTNDSATDTDTPGVGIADLAITKDDGVGSYTSGTQTTYTIVASNAGPGDVTGATVTDNVTSLPQVDSASWTCVAAGGASCTAGPVAGDIGDTVNLPVGGTVTYTLIANFDPAATGNLVNTATVAAPGGTTDPDGSDNSATDTNTQGASVADLSVTKTDGVTSYTPGGQVTYTIVAGNAGPSAVTGATVSDAVTALPQVDAASWTCVAAGGASCTAGPVAGDVNDTVNLPVGGTATYTLVVDIDPAATGNLANTASIAPPGGTGDPDPSDDSATDTDTQGAGSADLSITKDDGVASYTPGGQVTYTLVASNAGPSAVTGATVSDAVTALPQVDTASWTCVAAGGASCTAGPVAGDINDTVNLPVGGSVTYTLVVDLDPAATGNLVNTASIAPPAGTTDPDSTDDSAIDTDTQGAGSADLSITNDDGVASYTPGGQVTYTLVASNAGPSAVTGATVTDNVTSLPQVDSASWTCVAAGGASCTAGPVAGDIGDTVNLPVGGSVTYTLVVDLDPAATGNLVNTASVAPPGGTADPDGSNDSAVDTDTQGAPVADLSVTKDDGVASYTPGGQVTYTLVAGNAGPSAVTGATVTDAVTALPQIASASWTCVAAGGASCTAGPVAGDINDTVNLPVGGTATYTLVATIDVAATGSLANTANVAPPAGATDPDGSNDGATDTDVFSPPVADLSLSKTVDDTSPTVGDGVNFTLTVSNAGPAAATGIVVRDLLPSGYRYVGSLPSAGAYDDGTGDWSVGNLTPGGSETLVLNATVLAVGDHLNLAQVFASGAGDPDSTPGNGAANGEDDEAAASTAPLGTDAIVDITNNGVPGDVFTVTVSDPDMNADSGSSDTIQVTVRNDATGETETLNLVETGTASGLFSGTVNTIFGTQAGTDDDGTLNAQAGNTLTASYMDMLRSTPGSVAATDTAVIVGGNDAILFLTPSSSPGDTLTVRVTDPDENADPGTVESVLARVINNASGERETLTLTETGPDSGVFEATLPTVLDPAAGPDDDGILHTVTGQTLSATHSDQLTLTGATNIVSTTAVVGTADAVRLVKAANRSEIVVGSPVSYTIGATNTTSGPLSGVVFSDVPSAGLKYIQGSAQLVRAGGNGQLGDVDDVVEPINASGQRPVEFGPIVMAAGETVEVRYTMRAGSGAIPGEHVNRVTATSGGFAISQTATAVLRVVDDPVLSQSTIIGKVFEDLDRDGVQDAGERGVAQARVVLDDGTYVLTDEHGRYHFPAIAPGHRMLKLDVRSLPPGGGAVLDESRIVWITPGLTARANFGVLIRTEEQAIGQPAEPAIAVAGDTQHHPIQIRGRTEELSLLVNDTSVALAGNDVQLRVEGLSRVVRMKGNRFERPLEFLVDAERPDEIRSWQLEITDHSGRTIRRLQGETELPSRLVWDGRIDDGTTVPAGRIYFYQLSVDYGDDEYTRSARHIFGVGREDVISLQLSGGAFEVGGAELSDAARTALNQVGTLLSRFPDDRIVIEGHTDDQGDEESNEALSRRRAEAAASYLQAEWGFPEERIVLRWFGETRPLASNDIPEGREVNRRVAIHAEVEEVEDANVTDRYRTEPRARINGGAVEIGSRGRFTTRLDQGSESRLNVEMQDSMGRAVSATLELPRLEITAPDGRTLVGEERPANGCKMQGGAPACRLEGRTDPGSTVEVNGVTVATAGDGTFSAPLDLSVGENLFGVIARNGEGYSRSANLAVEVTDRDDEGNLLVVTRAIPNLSVRLPASDTEVYNRSLPLTGATDPGNSVFVNDEPVEVGSDGRFAMTAELPSGKSRLVVRVEDPEGNTGSIERDVEVRRTQLFMLAFGDAELGRISADGAIEANGEQVDEFYTEGRLAFYLKGVIRGKYLITAAFDSGRDELEDLFSDLGGDETDRLLRNLDPDRYYPVYGDSSTLVYDVESQGKLYLALDGEQIHAVIGNYPLALADTELAAYRRTLFGGRFIYQSASKTRDGRPDTEVVLFGADARHAHVRDELRATGGSLYYLSHREIIEGSEEVTLVVRDKHTGLVLERKRQRRNSDYTIKYPEGRLMFQRNLSSVSLDGSVVDQEVLAGHPVHVQVDYETAVSAFDKATSGVRVKRQLGNNVSVGGTYIADELPTGSYELGAMDAEIRAGKNTRIVAEFADSSGSDSLIYVSDDGGLSYTQMPASGLEEGSAWKLAAELDVGGWFGAPDRHRVNVFHKQLEPGFFSSGNFLEQGTDKTGLHGQFGLTDRDSLKVRFDLEDRDGVLAAGQPDQTTVISALWKHERKRWHLATEYFTTDVEDTLGATVRESGLGAVRLWSKLTRKLTGHVEHQVTLSGLDNDQTSVGVEFQALPSLALELRGTDGDRGSAAQAGAILTLGESSIYVKEQLSDDATGANTSTVVGARSPIGAASKVYTEYQIESGDRGDRTLSLVGLQRQWDPAQGLRFLLSGESANVQSAAGPGRRSTVATSVSWSKPDRLTLSTRNELRRESGTTRRNQFLTFSKFDYRLNDDLVLQAKYRYSKTENRLLGTTEARIDERGVGLAYRPTDGDRFNALAQYTHLLDLRPPAAGDTGGLERSMDVLSIETVFAVTSRLEWVTKEAFRIQQESGNLVPEFESATLLAIQRLNIDIWRPIVLGVEFRTLQDREADDRRQGWLGEVMWKVQRNFRIGGGFNFTDFSDNEFSQHDYSTYGWFLRIQGRY